MSKDYILSRQDLKNVIIGAKSFLAQKCIEMISRGEDPRKATYKQTDALIDEFIDSLKEVRMENMLDKLDEIIEKTSGVNIKEFSKMMENSDDNATKY